MRKLILLMLLAMVSSGAAAEWVRVGKSAGDGFDYYADPATIRRSGNYVKMWVVYDYQTPQVVSGQQFLSTKLQFEYDCRDMRSRMLYATTHSGNMANLDVVATVNNPTVDWGPISPATLGEQLWKFACRKH